MPDTISPIALAEQAQQITPEDASYLNRKIETYGISPSLVDTDLSQFKDTFQKVENGASYAELADSPEAVQWLMKAHNASVIQDDLQSTISFRNAMRGLQMPKPADMFDLAGAYLAKTPKQAALGLASLGAGLAAPFDGGKAFWSIADVSTDVEGAYREKHAELVGRLLDTGGNKFQVLLGDIGGQSFETLATGGLSALAAKTATRGVMKVIGTLATEQSVALTGMGVIQGVTAGAQNLTARAFDNVDAGKDPVSGKDIAASLAIAAMTAITSRIAGMTGEARLLGGVPGVTTWKGVLNDALIQSGEGTIQEVGELAINNLADGRLSSIDEYGWNALGGFIGDGLFATPAFISKLTSHLPQSEQAKAAAELRALSAVASAPHAVANAQGIAIQQSLLAQNKQVARGGLTIADFKSLIGTSTAKQQQHFDAADFAKIAEKFNMSPEDLATAWGGKNEGGTVSVATLDMLLGTLKAKPDQMAAILDHARNDPSQPSLADIVARVEDIKKIAAEDGEPTLPGGVKDDSVEIEKAVAKEVEAAQKDTKRSVKMSVADARLEAARWRAAATTWNEHYAASGSTERVTPKQLYDQSKASVTAGTDSSGTLAQSAYHGTGNTQPYDRFAYDKVGGKGGEGDRGAYDPGAVKINKNADASTVQHELTHHWLEVLRSWSADPKAPQAFRDQLTAIGTWAGSKAETIAKHYTETTGKRVDAYDIQQAAANMGNLDLTTAAGKAIHEGFTGAFEQYLATGKAPTTALKKVFITFARWMRNVVRSFVAADLLSPDAKAFFDRMLTSHDQIAQPHLEHWTAESLNITDTQFALINDIKDMAIRESQIQLEKILEKRAKEYAKLDEKTLESNVKGLIDAKPDNRARFVLKKTKLDRAAVQAAIKDPEALKRLEPFLSDTGIDPAALADQVGYSSEDASITMLQALSDGKDYDTVLAEGVAQAKTMNPPMSMEDRINELRVSSEGRAIAANAEYAAIEDAVRVAKQGNKDIKAAATEATETATDTVKADAAEKYDAAKAAWKAKAKANADQMRMQKLTWDVEGQRMMAELEQDHKPAIEDGAAYRLSQKRYSPDALRTEHDAKTKQFARAIKNRDWGMALNLHLEILTLSAMRQQLAAKTVEDVKADAAARKSDTWEALAAKALYDSALMTKLAQEKLAHTPAVDLREGVWSRRADAARRRREKAVADQNVPAIKQATQEIAWAETMEAETLNLMEQKLEFATGIEANLSASVAVDLAYAGNPTITYADGTTEVFDTMEDLDNKYRNIRGFSIGATKAPGSDLVNIRNAVKAVMSNGTRAEGIAMFAQMLNGKEGGENLRPRMKAMIEKQLSSPQQPAGSSALDPDNWTLDDWSVVWAQLEMLGIIALDRPRLQQEKAKIVNGAIGAVDTTAKAPKQREEYKGVSRVVGIYKYGQSVGLNLRSLGSLMKGAWFNENIMQRVLDAEGEGFALKRRIQHMVQKQIDAINGPLRKQMDAKSEAYGITSTGWERASRLLMLGTQSGKDRVIADLVARGCTNIPAYLAQMRTNVTQQEVDLLNAWWKANDEVWRYQRAAMRNIGIREPRTLEAMPFEVLVDGKPTTLTGGYAAVPYLNAEFNHHILAQNGQVDVAFMDLGFTYARAEGVNRMLDLSIEKQFQSQQSKIRTAALLPHAHAVSAVIRDRRFSETAKKHYGEDWYNDLVGGLQFAFNGDREAKSALNRVARFGRLGFTFSVYWGNLLTAARQLPGVVSSFAHPDIGFKATIGSIARLMVEWSTMSERVAQSSYVTLMRTHAQDPDYLSPDEVTTHGRAYEKWLAAGTWPMRRAQWVVDVVTWDAAFNKAMADMSGKGMDAEAVKAKAIAKADKALHETQGSAMRGEAAIVSQTEMGRLLTFGTKWMLNYGNFLRRQYQAAIVELRTGDTWEARSAFAKSVLVGLIGNAAVFAAVGAALRPEDDDDEQRSLEDYAWSVGMDIVSTPNHIVRAFGVPMMEAWLNNTKNPKISDGGMELAGEKGIISAKLLTKNVGYLFDEDTKNDKYATPQKLVGDAVTAGALVLPGIPSVMIKRIMESKDHEAGWAAFVQAALFGWDKTPMRKD